MQKRKEWFSIWEDKQKNVLTGVGVHDRCREIQRETTVAEKCGHILAEKLLGGQRGKVPGQGRSCNVPF
jgi:hypothetical protein